jgi:transcription antitermination factor NusG
LPELVSNYNSFKHSTILKAPIDVTEKDVTKIRSAAFDRGEKARKETNNFEVGDSVRILKNKKVFEKGTEKWFA